MRTNFETFVVLTYHTSVRSRGVAPKKTRILIVSDGFESLLSFSLIFLFDIIRVNKLDQSFFAVQIVRSCASEETTGVALGEQPNLRPLKQLQS